MAGEFELTRNITIGQYLPTGSIIHRMDPRFKLAAFVVVILAVAFAGSYGANVLGILLSAILFPIARIPIRYGLSGIKPALPFIIILAVLQLLFYGNVAGGHTYWHWTFIRITDVSVRVVIVSSIRFVEIIFLVSILTLSTSTTELSHGMESLLSPLKRVRFPVHAFALTMTIAVRFVPTFAMEMEKMLKAQASRGAEFGTGEWWRIVQRTKSMFPIIIPLFNVALSRAEDLILAMEARCYVPTDERTRYKRYRAQLSDWLLLLVGLVAAMVLLSIPY